MKALPPSTVQLISSGQVITSIASGVKELVENSLDANCTTVHVRLENYGLDLLEVRDNGRGISEDDCMYVGLAHYTSKISDEGDLLKLDTYGFRGEALSSLCGMANVTIATRTDSDQHGRVYVLNNAGQITDTKPSAAAVGTTVSAANLFLCVPVRRQLYKNNRRCREELHAVEDQLLAFALAAPHVRFQLSHNKQTVWQKTASSDLGAAAVAVFGTAVFGELQLLTWASEGGAVEFSALLPKATADPTIVLRSSTSRSVIIVNKRPVEARSIHKVIRQAVFNSLRQKDSRQHPTYCLQVELEPHLLDVNINPSKTVVLMQNEDVVLQELSKLLEKAFPLPEGHNQCSTVNSSTQRNGRANNAADILPSAGEDKIGADDHLDCPRGLSYPPTIPTLPEEGFSDINSSLSSAPTSQLVPCPPTPLSSGVGFSQSATMLDGDMSTGTASSCSPARTKTSDDLTAYCAAEG